MKCNIFCQAVTLIFPSQLWSLRVRQVSEREVRFVWQKNSVIPFLEAWQQLEGVKHAQSHRKCRVEEMWQAFPKVFLFPLLKKRSTSFLSSLPLPPSRWILHVKNYTFKHYLNCFLLKPLSTSYQDRSAFSKGPASDFGTEFSVAYFLSRSLHCHWSRWPGTQCTEAMTYTLRMTWGGIPV